MATFSIKVKSFTKMESPVGNDNITKYLMYAKTNSLEDGLMQWFETNPRHQNTRKKVSKGIKDSLIKKSDYFHHLNKGILFSVNYVNYDEEKNLVKFSMDNNEIHGNIDGGHTLKVILELNAKNKSKDAYVFIEMIVGIKDRTKIIELAEARNKTIQVDTKSLANLKKQFDPIKELLKNKEINFKDRIAYKMNEEKDGKDIDIRYVVSIINMFNLDIYENRISSQHPKKSYIGKETPLGQYLRLDKKSEITIKSSVEKFGNIIEEIFKLHDLIEHEFPYAFNSNFDMDNYQYKTYAILENGSNKKSNFAKFDKKRLHSRVPTGIIYPILGSFRALVTVEEETGNFQWISNPIKAWEKHKNNLSRVIATDKNVDTPNLIGKSDHIWEMTFKQFF